MQYIILQLLLSSVSKATEGIHGNEIDTTSLIIYYDSPLNFFKLE